MSQLLGGVVEFPEAERVADNQASNCFDQASRATTVIWQCSDVSDVSAVANLDEVHVKHKTFVRSWRPACARHGSDERGRMQTHRSEVTLEHVQALDEGVSRSVTLEGLHLGSTSSKRVAGVADRGQSRGPEQAGESTLKVRSNDGVEAGIMASQVGQFTVDAKGRITSAAAVAITPGAIGALSISSVTGSGVTVLQTSPSISTPTINGYVEGNTSLGVVGASATLSIASSTVLTATLTAGTATTFTMPAAAAGKAFTLYLKQPASGAVGSATFTGVKWQNDAAPIITQLNGRLDILPFVSDGVNWYGSSVQNFVY